MNISNSFLLFFLILVLTCCYKYVPREEMSNSQGIREELKSVQFANDLLLSDPNGLFHNNISKKNQRKTRILLNGSFEDKIRPDTFTNINPDNLKNWYDFDYLDGNSPVTWFSLDESTFNVNILPSEGDRFIGLVVRSNGTFEGIYQHLNHALRENLKYEFSLDINHSADFQGTMPIPKNGNPFGLRAILDIYLINSETGELHLIQSILPKKSGYWEERTINFIAPCNCDQVLFESAFLIEESRDEYYNGNVLIDNVSDIIEVK